MKNKNVFSLFNLWANQYFNNKRNQIKFHFSERLLIGEGFLKCNVNDKFEIQIGISPLSNSFFVRNQMIDDLDFVKIGVTMFHEFGHYEQLTNKDVSKEILISDLSKFRNDQYYKDNWSRFPHEIDAEDLSVLSMWSKLEDMYPDKADSLMLEYVTNKSYKNYMLKQPDIGFQSKEQIKKLFEETYKQSLATKRNLSAKFLRSQDEIAQLFTEDNGVINVEYHPFYHQIQTAETGQEMDIKMASLVSYIHPELQELYPSLNFKELNPFSVFGIPMPETRDEILSRIDTQFETTMFFDGMMEEENIQNFTDAVANIPISNNQIEQ